MPADQPAITSYRRILHPTDFSHLAGRALEHAKLLARTFKAELHLLHVVDEAAQYWMTAGPDAMPLGVPPVDLTGIAKEQMDTLLKNQIPADLPVITATVIGRPFVEIIGYAEQKGVDLIILGTHGRGAIVHALMGSTAERVVRKSHCAVLTVHDPEHAAATA